MLFLGFLGFGVVAVLVGVWRHQCIYMEKHLPINCPLGWRKGWARIGSWLLVALLSLMAADSARFVAAKNPETPLAWSVFWIVIAARWGASRLIGYNLAEQVVAPHRARVLEKIRQDPAFRQRVKETLQSANSHEGDEEDEVLETDEAEDTEGTATVESSPQEPSKTAMDDLIHAIYGNPPPEKTANLGEAIQLAYEDLLMEQISKEEVSKVARGLYNGPIPYSTHDLAVSVALNFFKRPDLVPVLTEAQMLARLTVTLWFTEKKVVAPLCEAFENTLYKVYKP